MADLCFDCVQDPGGPSVEGRLNDLRHAGPGYIYAICGGCGLGYFDTAGRRMSNPLLDAHSAALPGTEQGA